MPYTHGHDEPEAAFRADQAAQRRRAHAARRLPSLPDGTRDPDREHHLAVLRRHTRHAPPYSLGLEQNLAEADRLRGHADTCPVETAQWQTPRCTCGRGWQRWEVEQVLAPVWGETE